MPFLMSLTLSLADFYRFHNYKEALISKHFSGNWGSDRGGEGSKALRCLFPPWSPAVCSGVGWLPPSRSARSPVTQPSLAGQEPGHHGKGRLPKPKQPVLICRCSRACLLCLIAELWLNLLQGEELTTIQGGMTIVS